LIATSVSSYIVILERVGCHRFTLVRRGYRRVLQLLIGKRSV